jgi:hypothetical protein
MKLFLQEKAVETTNNQKGNGGNKTSTCLNKRGKIEYIKHRMISNPLSAFSQP